MNDIVSFFKTKKKKKEKITSLTAYDFPCAKILEDAGIDLILVGDSLGNVILGYENTKNVSIAEIIHHTKAVKKGIRNSFLVADMPLKSFRYGEREALKDARALIKAGACAVKIEGITHIKIIKKIIKDGIPVMGHIGYTPQSMGSPSLQGKDGNSAEKLIEDSKKLEDAGVFSIVLELIEKETSKLISQKIKIPTIGIGAGSFCDGQILVLHDMIGLYPGKTPKFVKQYAMVGDEIKKAVANYIEEVKDGRYPQN